MEENNRLIKVAVLRGGISPEYDVSLEAGKHVLENLDKNKYDALDILVDKNGLWHLKGVAIEPNILFNNIDIVFNTLYGDFGEDGKIQRLLETFAVPYVGSSVLPSAISLNKKLLKEFLSKSEDFELPIGFTINKGEDSGKTTIEAFRSVPNPWIIKTVSGGSSLGLSLAKDFQGLVHGIEEALKYSDTALVEEYVSGRELFCGIVPGLRGEEQYLLPIFEIFKKGEYLDYQSKVEGLFDIEISKLPIKQKEKITNIVHNLSKELNLTSYAEFKFVLAPKGLYLVEINSLPKLTSQSSFIKALDFVGVKQEEFLGHLIDGSLEG